MLARSPAFGRVTILTEAAEDPSAVRTQAQTTVERIWCRGRLDTGLKIGARLAALDPDVAWFNLGVSMFGRSPLANLSGLLGPLAARCLRIPSVVTMHEAIEEADFEALGLRDGAGTALGAKLLTVLMLQGDVTCVTLGCHARRVRESHPGRVILHIPHGAFDPPERLPEGAELELLHFGSQAPFKGLELLLHVFQDVRMAYPEIQLTVAGAPHPRFPGYLERLRRRFRDQRGIRWMGTVPVPDVEAVFGRASVVVLPQTATTGSSSVLCRAATWGRPVVASDLPELRATAQESGFEVTFFPAGDADGLREALLEVLGDPERREAQVRHNLAAVGSARLEATCRQYVEAFNTALASRDPAAGIVPVPSCVEEAV
jgi:glycosyltransferase involved in cell wall biosynthesis